MFAKNGSFHYVAPAIEPVGNYNVTAEVIGNKGEASASFNVVYPPRPYLAITIGILSLISFIYVLLAPRIRKVTFGPDSIYLAEVVRFLSLTGIAFTIVSFFLYIDLQFAINSPVGLVIKNSAGTEVESQNG